MKAANDLFSRAQLPAAGAGEPMKHALVIDPLIDGVSGSQSVATQSMEARLVELVKSKYPQFTVQPFSTEAVAKSPIVLVGTFTGVNKEGKTEGVREAFRVCLALADLKSGKIISKGVARAKPEGVDITPTAYFNDSPAWTPDQATEGYIKTCQGTKPGDPINPLYADRILTAALVSEAIDAYNNRQYRKALDLYQSALRSPGGEQLRVYNGLYLASWKVGRRNEAAQAFGRIVDYGLTNKRLAVKFLFKPGSTDFWPDRQVTGPYPVWLKQIAQRTAENKGCLEIVGHTSRTGPEPINDRLSLLRAGTIKQKLESDAPELRTRTIANGVGSRENLVGTATDDARDALDRRVEFKVVDCRAPI
ncbi:MAG TPA: OmpA family protein [Xanthomonadaceae bacterium]|nr:OmpA family protein [Xanthomonadaceae bacterium]